MVKTEADHEKDREDSAMVLGWASKILNRSFNAVPELANHLRRSGVVLASPTVSQVVSHGHGKPAAVVVRSQSSNGQPQVQLQPHVQVQTGAGPRRVAVVARSQSTCSTPVAGGGEANHGAGRSVSGPNNNGNVTIARRPSSSSLGFGVLGSVKEGDLIFGQQNGFLLAANTGGGVGAGSGASAVGLPGQRSAFQVTAYFKYIGSISTIDDRCEDGRFPVSASFVTIPNPDTLSSSEKRSILE